MVNRRNRILEHRTEHSLSQARLAFLADVHPNTVAKLERDEMAPTLPLARRIAGALGVGVDDLWPMDKAS